MRFISTSSSRWCNQIKIDLGDQVAGLAATRLCLDENAPSVKQQAETIGVTRARVYQLLEDCAKVMDVRWPEGRWLFAPLATRFGTSDPETIGLVHGIIDLFFPAERGGDRCRRRPRRRSRLSSGASEPGWRVKQGGCFHALAGKHVSRSTISTSPASIYCPPSVWWQWTAIVLLPAFSSRRASSSNSASW